MLRNLKRKQPNSDGENIDKSEAQPSTSVDSTLLSRAIKQRLYSDAYLSFGFTQIGDNGCPLLLCIVCGKQLSNIAMVPAKIKRHFNTNHQHLVNKTADYFKRLLESQGKESRVFEKKVTISDKAQEASYLIDRTCCTKNEKSHSWGKSYNACL